MKSKAKIYSPVSSSERLRFFPVWAIGVLIGLAIGTVWLRLQIIRTTYEINQSKKMILNAQHELEQIELEVTRLRSPRHLEGLAKNQFGLQPPRASQMVYLKAHDPHQKSGIEK